MKRENILCVRFARAAQEYRVKRNIQVAVSVILRCHRLNGHQSALQIN